MMAMELRKIPSKLESLMSKIGNTSLQQDLTELIHFAQECVHSFMYSFDKGGNAILENNEILRRIDCPSRVEVKHLYQTLQRFKSSIQILYDKTVKLRSMIHDVVMDCDEERQINERELSYKQQDIDQCEVQIMNVEHTIEECEEKANNMEIGARELEERARSLRVQLDQDRLNSLFKIGCVVSGIISAPYTAGTSLVAGLYAAGLDLNLNFKSVDVCNINATYLKDLANVERRKAADQRNKKYELEAELKKIQVKIDTYERTIKELSEAHDVLVKLKDYLLRSIKYTGDSTNIFLNLEKTLKWTEFQCDTFELLQQFFVDEPKEDFYAETYAEFDILKKSWKELTDMILIFSESRGIDA